jgi:hypothetical protein
LLLLQSMLLLLLKLVLQRLFLLLQLLHLLQKLRLNTIDITVLVFDDIIVAINRNYGLPLLLLLLLLFCFLILPLLLVPLLPLHLALLQLLVAPPYSLLVTPCVFLSRSERRIGCRWQFRAAIALLLSDAIPDCAERCVT